MPEYHNIPAFFIAMNWYIDAHEDLAWNIASFNRNYTGSAAAIRKSESSTDIPKFNGDAMLGYEEYNRGNIAIVFGTLFAIPSRPQYQSSHNLQIFSNPTEANQLYWQQLEIYRTLCKQHSEKFRLILTKSDLHDHVTHWEAAIHVDNRRNTVGIVPLMEGADGILSTAELETWWSSGLRIIGLAWAGNRYCGGTNEPGPLTTKGEFLLKRMAELGFILDLSHMDSKAAYRCLEIFPGKIIASHSNASRLVRGYNGNRLLDDNLIQAMIARDAVIGIVPFNNFLVADWQQQGGRSCVGLHLVTEQVDHICQLAGDCDHVGFGTDFDGGFGMQSAPIELETIADLPKIEPLLSELGFSSDEISKVASGNFHRVLESGLPD